MDMEELAKELADLKAKVAELENPAPVPDPEPEASEPPVEDKVGELSEKMNDTIRQLTERLDALEKLPQARTHAKPDEERVYI